MQLYYWRGTAPNFGDELNAFLWPSLLPDFFDDDATELFLGIGSVLDDRHPADAFKIVAGAGYGGYRPPPALDARWAIHWVRGPRTAARLGLPAGQGLGDPASLLDREFADRCQGIAHRIGAPARPSDTKIIGFMPHFETAARGIWPLVADRAGMAMIDPRDDVPAVLGGIGRCRLLICEAMHGAIVADALRVPWIAVAPLARVHAAKWADWGGAMNIRIAFQRLSPSSPGEHLRLLGLTDRPAIRGVLDRSERRMPRFVSERYLDAAAATLRRAAWASPQLSDNRVLDSRRDQMRQMLRAIRRDPRLSRSRNRHEGRLRKIAPERVSEGILAALRDATQAGRRRFGLT